MLIGTFFNRIWQNMLPQHWLSHVGGRLADSQNRALKNWLCQRAIKTFDINLSEANSTNLDDYKNFNDFFDRYLISHARPIDSDKTSIVSPSDGILSQCGQLLDNPVHGSPTLIQAKGKSYLLSALIHDDDLAKDYINGHFATIYLSPQDYHRVHSPIDGTLIKSEYIPGSLYAVNDKSVNAIDQLFTRNERLVCHLDTYIGCVIVVFVGALFVSGIRTQWIHGKPPSGIHTLEQSWFFSKGSELGLFRFGSTVILIFPPNQVQHFTTHQGETIKMGQSIANVFS